MKVLELPGWVVVSWGMELGRVLVSCLWAVQGRNGVVRGWIGAGDQVVISIAKGHIPDQNLIVTKSGSLSLADGFDAADKDCTSILGARLADLPDSLNLGRLDIEGIDESSRHFEWSENNRPAIVCKLTGSV